MELKEFINKVVVNTTTNRRFLLQEITEPEIKVMTVEPDERGIYTWYAYRTINGDPFATGRLVFEDPALAEPFREAYDAYCKTEDAYWESFDYWMRRD